MASSSQSKVCCSSPTSKNKANSKSSRIWFSANKKSATFSISSSNSASAFRQKFLHALQFYCDTPSLVLNSDLPSDLVEFVTSQEFPVETLGVILELKRGVNVNSSTTTTTRASELSRKLAESWISADSCAEALGSLSLGDEVPGVIAETSSLYRLLFSISDNFHIPPEQFQTFILSQIIITIQALVYGVAQESYDGIIRSQVLGNLLDRTFIRFHSDAEQFVGRKKILTLSPTVPAATKNNQEKDDEYDVTPFAQFVDELGIICKDDFITRRLLSRILVGLGNQAAFKFAKTTFLIGLRDTCPATTIFSPSDPFFTSTTWNNILSSSIPTKTRTKSPLFWTNWAFFMIKCTSSTTLASVWSNGVTSWQNLCRSSAVSYDTVLLPATYALIALAREIKLQLGEDNSEASVTTKNILVSSTSQVLESVAKCLDSTDEGKKACGMGLAQVIGDLHMKIGSGKVEAADSGHSKLKFTSKHAIFKELINFYENGFKESIHKSTNLLDKTKKKIQVLDSDDDDDEDEDEKEADDVNKKEASQLNHFDETDPPVDERILDYRSKKGGRLPQYFSEFVEILLEGGGKNEVDMEAVKQYCIMKIPLLLSVGIRIDPKMAEVLIKCLLDYDTSAIPSLELPILFSIYELTILHPTNVIEIIATATFDDDHYTSGHRMVTLQRLAEVVQLLSKSKCFSCHSPELERHRLDLISISPDFITKYFNVKKKLRSCSDCKRIQNVSNIPNSGEEQDGKTDSDAGDLSSLTWREIVDRRVASKTRYFFKSRNNSSSATPLPDTYSTTLIPIIWSSLANRMLSKASYFVSEEERVIRGAPRDMLLAQMFRLLGRILLPGGGTCPHLGSIAGQVGHLSQTFATHPDGTVRQSVIALVAITITISDGATYVIEAISGSSNIFESLKQLREQETLPENKALLDHVIAYLTQAAVQHAASSSSTSLQDGINSMLRFLPDRKLQLN